MNWMDGSLSANPNMFSDPVMRTSKTTYYLEMTDPSALRPSRVEGADVEVRQARIPCPEFSRFLFAAVGGDWFWLERLNWTYAQWLEYLAQTETWVLYVSGTSAGYFELRQGPGTDIEIVQFGLLRQFIGQGLGGYLLTVAIRQAWAKNATRVWLHTSSLDHSNALANYRARGFKVFKQEVTCEDLPEKAPGPWPGVSRESRPAASIPSDRPGRLLHDPDQ